MNTKFLKMKKISIYIFIVMALLGSACSRYLDVNTNPNQATSATPQLVFPQALVATGMVLNGFNTYGAEIGGYAANAGGYGGFGEFISYQYTSADFTGGTTNLWGNAYDNLEDYQYVINSTAGQANGVFFNAAATIMRVYVFELLVDAYNDIPYSEALQGADNLTPTYDKATDIYPALAVELDGAIANINSGLNAATAPDDITAYDVLFNGEMTSWLQLANTIKLRLMIRTHTNASSVTYANSNFDPAGFLTADALINPGYARATNQQNPTWNSWVYSPTGTSPNKAWMPTTWIMSFYNGQNLLDTMRGKAAYYNFRRVQFPNTPGKRKVVYGDSISNQLGYQGNDIPACPSGTFWYSGTDRGGTTAGDAIGLLKDPSAGLPMFTAAESYFLQAEAIVVGLTVNGASLPAASESYKNGVTASFNYLYSDKTGKPTADTTAISTMVTNYFNANSADYRANFSAANGSDQQIEAIITQKYIALNFVNSHEGWNEFRRTGYPKVSTTGSTNPTLTFASFASAINNRPDRLPTRIPYPVTEGAYNSANVPQLPAPVYSSNLIFWAK